jgi:hypothetical protein
MCCCNKPEAIVISLSSLLDGWQSMILLVGHPGWSMGEAGFGFRSSECGINTLAGINAGKARCRIHRPKARILLIAPPHRIDRPIWQEEP